MTKVHSSHTQWAAGQGFFRTGQVSTHDVTVNYVYDCGSVGDKPQCKKEIAEYASVDRPDRIDMVFLSHFDLDHVNCVPDLARALPIARFIIPLVHPAERLMVLVEALYSSEPPEAGDWFVDLIVDPVPALRGLHEGADVVEIEPGTQAALPEVVEPPDQPAEEEGEGATSWAPPGPDGASGIDTEDRIGSRRVVWLWAPYVLKDASRQQDTFTKAIAREIGITEDQLGRDLQDVDFVRQLVISEVSSRRKGPLKKAYDAAVKDRNITSLLLYSGPAVRFGPGSTAASWRARGQRVNRPEVAAWNIRPGWLGTGDAPITTPARVDEVVQRFRPYFGGLGTLALPHHGSKHSLHPDILDAFGDPLPTCIVSSGAPSRYQHPHLEVTDEVANRGYHLVRITGDPRSRWTSTATSWL